MSNENETNFIQRYVTFYDILLIFGLIYRILDFFFFPHGCLEPIPSECEYTLFLSTNYGFPVRILPNADWGRNEDYWPKYLPLV